MIPYARGRNVAAAIAIAVMVSLQGGSASAESPEETAIRDWIAAIDASPDWVAGFGELAYDEAKRTATLRDLAIRSEFTLAGTNTKTELTFGQIAFVGFAEDPDGRVRIEDLRYQDAHLVTPLAYMSSFDMRSEKTPSGDTPPRTMQQPENDPQEAGSDLHIRAGTASGILLPKLLGIPFDPDHPFASVISLLSELSKIEIAKATAEAIDSGQVLQTVRDRSTIGSFELSGMRNGRIESQIARGLKQARSRASHATGMTADTLEIVGFDTDALFAVLNPDRYAGGRGDRKWRPMLQQIRYRDWSFAGPGLRLNADSLELDGLKARQPFLPLVPRLDELASADESRMLTDLFRFSLDVLSSFGLDQLQINGLVVKASGLDRLHFHDVHIADLSSDGIGEIGLSGLDLAATGLSAQVERFALGQIRFASADNVVAAVGRSARGIKVDPLTLMPALGHVEIVGTRLRGEISGDLGRARLDLVDPIGPIPTKIALAVEDLAFGIDYFDESNGANIFSELGFEQLRLDQNLLLRWEEADASLKLEDFRLTVRDACNLSATATIRGVPRSMFEDPKTIRGSLFGAQLAEARFVFEDNSLLSRAVAMRAKALGETLDQAREGALADMQVNMKSLFGNTQFEEQLVAAAQPFYQEPGRLTFTAEPTTPVALVAIAITIGNDVFKLPNLLGVQVRADPPSPPH